MTAEAQTQPSAPGVAMLRALGGIAMLSGLLVVLVYQFTLPIIAENQRIASEKAVFRVIPGAVSKRDFVLEAGGLTPLSEAADNGGERVYAAYDGEGRLLGVAFSGAAQGYQDTIKLLFGYDPICQCVVGSKVLKSTETPGLGDKIDFDPDFMRNFEALDARLNAAGDGLANPIQTVKHGSKTEPWQIDAVSGATISSNALGKALDASAQRLVPLFQRDLAKLSDAGG